MLKLIVSLVFATSLNFAQAIVHKSYSTSSMLAGNDLTPQERFWLGPAGPLNRVSGAMLSSRGVMGYLGPFGKNWWNVTPVFETLGNWRELSKQITEMGGPLSEMGPLLSNTVWGNYFTSFDFIPGSGDMLAAGGSLMPLGPSGVMSPLGIGGALGPHGAHGFEIGKNGEYRNQKNQIVRKIRGLRTAEGKKTYNLFEYYKGKFARSFTNDTSFMAEDSLPASSSSHTYNIVSLRKQWVGITLINLYDLDSFKLTVMDSKNNVIATSDDFYLTNFVAVKTGPATKLKIIVECKNSLQLFSKSYRLNVLGSRDNYTVEKPFHN